MHHKPLKQAAFLFFMQYKIAPYSPYVKFNVFYQMLMLWHGACKY